MKKRRVITISCIVILAIVIAAGIINMNMPIVSMSRSVSNGEQVANGGGFTIDTAKKVLIRYNSHIKNGNLSIRLTDKDWNTIKEFQSDAEGKENIYLEKGEYYIRVESDYFNGSYLVKAYD